MGPEDRSRALCGRATPSRWPRVRACTRASAQFDAAVPVIVPRGDRLGNADRGRRRRRNLAARANVISFQAAVGGLAPLGTDVPDVPFLEKHARTRRGTESMGGFHRPRQPYPEPAGPVNRQNADRWSGCPQDPAPQQHGAAEQQGDHVEDLVVHLRQREERRARQEGPGVRGRYLDVYRDRRRLETGHLLAGSGTGIGSPPMPSCRTWRSGSPAGSNRWI